MLKDSLDIFKEYHIFTDSIIDWKKRLFVEIPFYELLLKKYKCKSLLHIDCGSGHHLHQLSDRIDVGVGIDKQSELISEAFSSRSNVSNINFLEGNIDEINKMLAEKRLPKTFDAVIVSANFFVSLLNKKNLKERIEKIRDLTSKHGIIILNLFNYEKVLLEREYHFKKIVFRRGEKLFSYIRHMKVVDSELVKYHAFVQDHYGYTHLDFEQLQNALTKKKMIHYLDISGLSVKEIYGSFAFKQFEPIDSPKLLMIVQNK